MHLHNMPLRGHDRHGGGEFGASRGGRSHGGIDLVVPAGEEILSPVTGEVTKLGYTYGDDLSYRYVEVTAEGYRYRLFYVAPTVRVGDKVEYGDPVGTAQNIKRRYPGITPHIHFEVRNAEGSYIDPTPVYWVLKSRALT